MNQSIDSIRKEYTLAVLSEENLLPNPISQFEHWFNQAREAEIDEVNAMCLSTVDEDHQPHSRIVLLKGLEENKFVFFTNYLSSKGKQIAFNPNVSLLFFWKELQRQVRVEGFIEKANEAYSETYFHSRPRQSQLGAWASHQSEKLTSRSELETRYSDLEKHYEGKEIPKPPHWGGFCVTPHYIEFWQGRASRLHDRLVYKKENEDWVVKRLNP